MNTFTSTNPGLPEDLIRQATYRRNGLAVFGDIDPSRTALLVLNMQNAWVGPGAPFSPEPLDDLLKRINVFAQIVREGRGQVAWIRTTVGAPGTPAYWSTYYDNFVAPELRVHAVAALTPESPMHELHPSAEVHLDDWVIDKHRFSAFAGNPYDLDRNLRDRGVENVIVVGTATNVCCESTIRDAQARDFRTFMPFDLVTAPTADGHTAGLRSVMQAFADVRNTAALTWRDAQPVRS
ncbi:cysteine hydrolase [Variovorax sp. Sphag1AA]|uniref:cysteine hydrolase n=1 Tax=Variovorax sp. Sphag1AA TaxID=2587027 RepID=UPI00160AB067|nr:cysteine hydrolase [Variovorax sp. Sphag1AA]MBB3182243.1 ureidoacrylate peracid hydrolase [Variovorax sp. Sphag1AA]